MISFRYIYGVIYIAGFITMMVINDTPVWGRIVISTLLLGPLVVNEFQIYRKSAERREEASLTNSVEDKVLHEYRGSSRV